MADTTTAPQILFATCFGVKFLILVCRLSNYETFFIDRIWTLWWNAIVLRWKNTFSGLTEKRRPTELRGVYARICFLVMTTSYGSGETGSEYLPVSVCFHSHSRLWHVIHSTTLGKMVLVLKKNRLLCSVLPCHWHHAVPPRVKDASLDLVSGQAWIIWNPLRSSVLENIFSNDRPQQAHGNISSRSSLDCSQSPIFPWDRTLSSTGRHIGI